MPAENLRVDGSGKRCGSTGEVRRWLVYARAKATAGSTVSSSSRQSARNIAFPRLARLMCIISDFTSSAPRRSTFGCQRSSIWPVVSVTVGARPARIPWSKAGCVIRLEICHCSPSAATSPSPTIDLSLSRTNSGRG